MSFKNKHLSNWDTEELKQWIQDSRLFDKKIEQRILTCVNTKSYNGWDFYSCYQADDVKQLINTTYDNWVIDDEIANRLYKHIKHAKQTYPMKAQEMDQDTNQSKDHGKKINKTTADKESFERKCLIHWTATDLKQFIKSLTDISLQSQRILFSKINENNIDGFSIFECNDAMDLQYLFKLGSPTNRDFFEYFFQVIQKATQKKQVDESYWNKHVFNWNANDVKSWLLALTPNMLQYTDYFSTWNINGLSLILQSSDTQCLNFLTPCDSALVMQHTQDLCVKYNITDQELRNKKMDSQFGLIGLRNQGNTCFMNTAIQLILQSPQMYQYLQCNHYDSDNATEYSKFNPKRFIYQNKKKKNICFMIDYLIELHSQSRNHEYNCIEPALIFNRICQIDGKYKQKRQQDCGVIISLMLQDVDKNLNRQIMNESDEKQKGIEIPFSSSIVVKKELSAEQQQIIIHQKLLKKHNPYNTLIRQSFDGVQKIVSTCLDCGWKRIEYETFRSLKLPLINNEMSISIEIYVPHYTNPIKHTFTVESYTKIYVLKHRIVQFILDNASNITEISMDNVVIGSILPSYRTNCNHIDDCIHFYDSNEKCSTLLSAVNLFATLKYNIHSKLMTIFNVKIDENECIKYDGIRFVEVKPHLAYRGSDLINLITDTTQNIDNICVTFEDRIIDTIDDIKYTFGRKINVLILIEMQNNQLASKWFPSLSNYDSDNIQFVEQWIIQDCINKYNSKYNKENNCVEHISLTAMINDLENRFKHSQGNNNFYIKPLQNVLKHFETQSTSVTNIIKYLQKCLSTFDKNVVTKPILHHIYDCISEFEREKILDSECSQMYCKKCGKKPKIFSEKISIVYSPLNLTFRIERNKDKQKYKDKFTHLVEYPYKKALVLSNGDEHNLYGVGIHSSWDTLAFGHYIAYIKSCYNDEWYEINDSSIHHIAELNKIQNREAIILMYTKST